jgi:hypothetical protein
VTTPAGAGGVDHHRGCRARPRNAGIDDEMMLAQLQDAADVLCEGLT